jgi:hypothetical protein
MRKISASWLGLLLLLLPTVRSQCTLPSQIEDDSCSYKFDLECDPDMNFCLPNSDCVDCDIQFMQFREQGCQVCVENGGWYCENHEGEPFCNSPEIAAANPTACSPGL